MDDRPERLQQLFALFEQNLKRELTGEERRLLALASLYLEDGDAAGPAAGETAS